MTCSDALNIGAKGVLRHFKDSLATALESVYPEYIWFPWPFDKVPQQYWKDISNHRKYFEWLKEELECHHTFRLVYCQR